MEQNLVNRVALAGALRWEDLQKHRFALLTFLAIVLLISGIRFSDGHLLLAIAHGGTVADPAFSNPASQYVWDSPLKVWLLWLLPPRVLVIAVTFTILAFLPCVGLLSRSLMMFRLTVVALCLTPAFKISIQNIGLGDGLEILAIIAMAATRRLPVLVAGVAIIALWHPQQSFFIGLSYLIASFSYGRSDRRETAAVLGTLAAAGVVFLVWKVSLGFSYVGRGDYMISMAGEFVPRNLTFAPIWMAPLAAWFAFLRPTLKHGVALISSWIAVLVVVSLLTADVTRVLTIVTLPIVLVSVLSEAEEGSALPASRVAMLALFILAIPPCSWSGLDWSVWGDFLSDLHKWGIVG